MTQALASTVSSTPPVVVPPPHAAPLHIAIVPDGNRRWARRSGKTTSEAYVAAAVKALQAAQWVHEVGGRHLSAFALSQENLAMRPADEIDAIRDGLFVFFEGLRQFPFTRLHLFGDLQGLVRRLPSWMPLLPYESPGEPDLVTVHVGLNYSGQAEIRALAEGARESFSRPAPNATDLLLSAGVPDVDLVFRSGGQQRLSGFLPFQTAFAELWFTDTLWPDVTRQDFERGLGWYMQQERRLGE